MTPKVLERLTNCGWTPERHVDISEIVKEYRANNMEMPDIVRLFLESFDGLTVKYPDPCNLWDGKEEHNFGGKLYYSKSELETMFEDYGLTGMIYPLGCAYRGNMELYYHENGKFYEYMSGGPLKEIGTSVDEMLNEVIGDELSRSIEIEPID